MTKTLALIKRLPALDRNAFREYYETRHVPLALPHVEGLQRYVRYHIEEDLYGTIGFDVVSAFWYRDRDAADAIFELLQSEAGKPILEDEKRFMDKPANHFFAVSERPWPGEAQPAGEPGEAGDEREAREAREERREGETSLFVFVARPESMSRYDCSKRLVEDHWPELIDALGGVAFALLRDAFAMEGDEARWDAVMQVCAQGHDGLEGWSAALEREGYRVAAVATRRFETTLA